MSTVSRLICVSCGAEYAPGTCYTCPTCGPGEGILDIVFNTDVARKTLTRSALATRDRNHWRYAELLPLPPDFKPVQPDVGWTPLIVLPAAVLPPLVAYALVAGDRLLPLPGSATPRIEAEGRQWVWTFRYPDYGGVETRNVLHLPAGIPVDIVVTSRDVIHAFWVPRLAGKIDAVPGHANHLRLRADEPGRYDGRCSEFCGLGHTGMRFSVVVHRAEDFAAAVAQAAKDQQ